MMKQSDIRMLSSVMNDFGLDPKDVKLVRHSYNNLRARDCRERGWIEDYQAIQKMDRFSDCSYVMSFIGEKTGTTAIFIGLFEVRGHREADDNSLKMHEGYPYPEEYKRHSFWYDLVRVDGMTSLEGKMKIEWGSAPRAWCQKGTSDKVVLEY